MPDFVKLQNHTFRLQQLLEDPHPGLVTWCSMVAQQWKAIAEMWYGKENKEESHVGREA